MSHSFSARRTKRRDEPRGPSAQASMAERGVRPSQTQLKVVAPASVVVTDAKHIAAILASLGNSRSTGTIRVSGARPSVDELEVPDLVELAPGQRLLVSAGFCEAADCCTWTVELQGAFSLVRFELTPAERGSRGHFAAPVTLECVYRRAERRVSAPPAALIRFRHSRHAGIWVERPLRDVGFGGLQFVAAAEDRHRVGERLRHAEISWKHGPHIAIVAQVRHVSGGDTPTQRVCGISISPKSEVDAEVWHREVASLLHPDTQDASAVDPELLWDLYASSGYFGLDGRNVRDFCHLKTAFGNASAKLGSAVDVSCKVVREYRGRVEATISLVRGWSGGWLACQMARRQEQNPLVLSGNALLRDMYLHAYETAQQHPSLRWHVTFVRKDARFSHLAYREFARPRIDDCTVAMVPFRAMQVLCTDVPAIDSRPELDIGEAEPGELRHLLRALANRFPQPYCDAYDFVPERFDLSEIRRDWDQNRLLRQRRVLVVRRKGEPLAAAILDFIEPGVHLVGLMDSVHLIELKPQGALEFPILLRAVQLAYREQGRREFALFEETGNPGYTSCVGARDLGEADQIFVAAALTANFLDHISAITAPRASQVAQ